MSDSDLDWLRLEIADRVARIGDRLEKWGIPMPRIKLHSVTADYIRGILDMLGYADTVFVQRWGHEPE